MDRGAWGATVHGVSKSWTWLSDEHCYSWPFEARIISCVVWKQLILREATWLLEVGLNSGLRDFQARLSSFLSWASPLPTFRGQVWPTHNSLYTARWVDLYTSALGHSFMLHAGISPVSFLPWPRRPQTVCGMGVGFQWIWWTLGKGS